MPADSSSKHEPDDDSAFVEIDPTKRYGRHWYCYYYGRMEITVERVCGLFGSKAVGDKQSVWMSHGDEVAKLPDGFTVVARSQQGLIAVIENPSKRFYGLQYHPEVTHSPEGMETLCLLSST